MARRKTFLAALGSVGVALAGRSAGTAASPKAASAAALATAEAMRRFDPQLSGEDVAKIARGIDDNRKSFEALDPRKARLSNGDEPVTVFSVREA